MSISPPVRSIQKCWIRIPTHMSRTVTHSKTRMRTSCEGAGYAESLSGASKDAERQLCGKVPEARAELDEVALSGF